MDQTKSKFNIDMDCDVDNNKHMPKPLQPMYELKQLNLKNKHIYYHEGQCTLNSFGQCLYGYKYFCQSCNIGLGGMYSTCLNNKCPQFHVNLFSDGVKDNRN